MVVDYSNRQTRLAFAMSETWKAYAQAGVERALALGNRVSWSNCTAENCLWVVPGSHRRWRLAGGGEFPPITERLPDAVPMLLAPGDCGIVNRSALHGSYPNESDERRVTMVLGFHKRSSAIGASTVNVHAFKLPGTDAKEITYTEDYVLRRARMIPLAIDARHQHRPDEKPFEYEGVSWATRLGTK